MRARTALATTVLAVATALLVGACGGSNNGSDKIKGADQGTASTQPSASPADPNTAKRPALKTDDAFNPVFQGWTSDDARKSAVLLDGKDQVLATDSAIFKLDPNAPEVAFYNADDALKSAKDWVAGFKKNQLGMVGTVRYYNPHVTFPASNVSALSYCSDESKGFSKDIKTGKAKTTTPSASDYVLYTTSLAKNSQGIWQTISFTSQEGRCQP